jgi:hypothetical protein
MVRGQGGDGWRRAHIRDVNVAALERARTQSAMMPYDLDTQED